LHFTYFAFYIFSCTEYEFLLMRALDDSEAQYLLLTGTERMVEDFLSASVQN